MSSQPTDNLMLRLSRHPKLTALALTAIVGVSALAGSAATLLFSNPGYRVHHNTLVPPENLCATYAFTGTLAYDRSKCDGINKPKPYLKP